MNSSRINRQKSKSSSSSVSKFCDSDIDSSIMASTAFQKRFHMLRHLQQQQIHGDHCLALQHELVSGVLTGWNSKCIANERGKTMTNDSTPISTISDDESSLCSGEDAASKQIDLQTLPPRKRCKLLSTVSFDDNLSLSRDSLESPERAWVNSSYHDACLQCPGTATATYVASCEHQEPRLFLLSESNPAPVENCQRSVPSPSSSHAEWNTVFPRIRAHPHEGSWQDPNDGWNALHWLLLRGAPAHVIRQVLSSNTAFLPLCAKTRRGSTPLHIACYFASGHDVISLLLEHEPTAATITNDRNETPLFCSLTSPLKNGQEGNGTGRSVSPATIQSLITAGNVSDAVRPNINGSTAVQEASARWIETFSVEEGSLQANKKEEAWQKLVLVVEAAYCHLAGKRFCSRARRFTDPPSFPLLHALIELASPLQIIIQAMHTYPYMTKEYDRIGRLPLYLACCIRSTDHLWKTTLVQCLVTMNPVAASSETAKGRRQLPLHAAIENGMHPLPDTRGCAIASLSQAFPSALYIPDSVTGLLPFMIPAASFAVNCCHPHQPSKEGMHNTAVESVNAIYSLLRQAPDVISGLIVPKAI
jgi:hypothetical protein